MQDTYGRNIAVTVSENGKVYSFGAGSVTLDIAATDAQALKIINGMAPANWTPPPIVPEVVSDRQFFQQAALAGIISQTEALAAVQTGTIPTILANIVSNIADTTQRFAAEMILSGAVDFHRHHPLTDAIGSALGWTSDQIDGFFLAASSL